MSDRQFEHEDARTIRTHWFRYLDTIEPVRSDLFGYCHRLTANVWDAEDLVQDTLLTGFGMAARGDFHGESSPVRNIKAYLFRTATNRWLDQQRRDKRLLFTDEVPTVSIEQSDPTLAKDAINHTAVLTSPQEFAAFLLKEAYDFKLGEIADFIGTTEGTIKSALSRARRKLREESTTRTVDPALKQLVNSFVDAMNSGDIDQVIELMAEQVQISVCNVGGGRGNKGVWSQKTMGTVTASYAECDGVPVVLMFKTDAPEQLHDVLRLDGDDKVTRIIDHCYAPEVLAHVAETAGLNCRAEAYHQPWEVISSGMVPTTFLPWAEQ